jgi:iron complex outermembrane receptor protein
MQHQLLAGAEYGWQKREPRLWMGSARPVSLTEPDQHDNEAQPEPWQMNYHKVKTAGFYAQDQIDLGGT